MSSLQEQLLKAGLVDKNKLKMAEKEKQKRSNQSRKAAGKSATRKVDPKKAPQISATPSGLRVIAHSTRKENRRSIRRR